MNRKRNIDYTKLCSKVENKKHSEIFPSSIRMIIAGRSGCGKTNLMINFLLNGDLEYNDVIIYTTTPYQKLYQLIGDYYQEIKNKFKTSDIIKFYSPEEDILNPSELDSSKTHIVIFDDVQEERQKVMTNYFCRGRHNNINVFYLCQSLHRLKKHGIRQNANIFILFRQDGKTLKYFYDTEISSDMSFQEFSEFCDSAWKKEYGYVVINIWEKPECGRYMQNYEYVWVPTKYKIKSL